MKEGRKRKRDFLTLKSFLRQGKEEEVEGKKEWREKRDREGGYNVYFSKKKKSKIINHVITGIMINSSVFIPDNNNNN